MTTANSRALLDWYREYAEVRYTILGLTEQASNMNLPFVSDVRVQAALDFVAPEEARLRLTMADDPALAAFWPAAKAELDADVAAMPTDIAALLDVWSSDPDTKVNLLLKAFYRILGMVIATVRFEESQ